jgi:NAD(P)-dependent dehydrogenase (short-subunit alcohol dehydrogenase family)
MKVLVIGAHGTIGEAVVKELSARHEIVSAGKQTGQHQLDSTDYAQVEALFEQVGRIDALVSAVGRLHFGPLTEMTPEQFRIGLNDKLMGQIHLALAAIPHLNDGGSITLTSGIVSEEPIRYGVNATTVNAALEGFARAAAIELPRGIRINVVSPNVLQESLEAYGPYFYGFEAVPAARVALAYSRSVEGAQTGRVYSVK